MSHGDEDFPRNPRQMFEAAMARHEARMRQAVRAHERAMKAAEQRMVAAVAAHELRLAEMAARMAARFGRPPQPPKRPRRPEGGEPVPAVPKPRPNPLAGGAAAPLDPDRRKPANGDARKGAGRVRLPSDADSRLSL